MPLEFVLARMLGRTVAELRTTMSAREFLHWTRFLGVERQNKELAAKRMG